MRQKLRYFAAIALLLSFIVMSSACSGFEDPDPRLLPSPVATVAPYLGVSTAHEAIVDPVSNVVPRPDPTIQFLLEEVSTQQLQAYVRTLESFGTRNSYSATEEFDRGIGAARRWIYSEFERVGNGRMLVEFQDFTMDYSGIPTTQRNIVATLPGNGRGNGVVVMGAHYDTRPRDLLDGESFAPGANDNAAGIALLLETARLLSSRQWNQTIVFVAFASEEQGTYGSRNFVQNAVLDGMNIIATLNFDVIGGEAGIPYSLRMFAQDLRQSNNGELGRYIEYIAGMYVPYFPITVIDSLDREGRYGDHREFISMGIPAVRFTQSVENPDLLNSVDDRWNRIDYNYHSSVVRMAVSVAANLLGGPSTPDTPLIFRTDPGNAVQVVWAVAGDAAGYVVSFRPLPMTTYPTFRYVRANQAGNVIFTDISPGIQYAVSLAAVDADGRLGDFTPEVLLDMSETTAASE
ncbi:MAG: M20/M25/M40 family metallo-hydrolase [Anaerolineales bacterium]|nr:M20/M25/M40 family metallo-hydrolase [Anaerolineales bacterium]